MGTPDISAEYKMLKGIGVVMLAKNNLKETRLENPLGVGIRNMIGDIYDNSVTQPKEAMWMNENNSKVVE